QRGFMSGRLRVVVATVAFGMGLDKPDVGAVVHYNMPKNFESYVQEIGRAGRDGRPARCHLFLDPEGGDLPELRRHVYGESVDFFALKKLVRKIFAPCKCRELRRRRRQAEEDDGDAVKPNGPRVCHMHDRAVPVRELVESLDVREEGIETLLCYLELHPRRWLELLPPTYSSCRLLCYGGARQLRDAARSCPPVAVVLARERLAGRDPGAGGSSVEFDVVELSDSMGWEISAATIRPVSRRPPGGGSGGKSGVLVEFGNLSFRFRAYGDLRAAELDSVCRFLHRRVTAREKTALGQLRSCFRAFQSVAFRSWGPHAEDEEEERSSRLKLLLRDYFGKEPGGPEEEEEEEEEEEGFGDAENRIRADVRHFLSIRHDEKFTGRAVARIFHGIGSPCFPAPIYGRDRRFWRKHLPFDFRRLARLAAEEILATG
ncbi:RECQ4 helicase, partial [Baryphthengus martii]|nr:RECQ4 helicase [Baryphthengus martii]